MWVFTQRGFVSVVEYDPKQDKHKGSPFAGLTQRRGSHVLVRSRVRNDLEDLRRVVPNMKIFDDTSADYKFRAVVRRKDFNKWLLLSADEIDYDSHFKEAAAQNSRGATGRYSAYMSVWSALMRLQTAVAYKPSNSTVKPLIGPGAKYGSVDEYLTDSGFMARQAKKAEDKEKSYKAWTPHGAGTVALRPLDVPAEVEEGSITVEAFIETLREEPLEMLSEMLIADLCDEAWDMWCYLDDCARKGDLDPLKPLPKEEFDEWIANAKEYAALPAADDPEDTEPVEGVDNEEGIA